MKITMISILEKDRAPSENVFRKGLGRETWCPRLLGRGEDLLQKDLRFLGRLRVADERVDKVGGLHVHQVGHDRRHALHVVVNGERQHHDDAPCHTLLARLLQQDRIEPLLHVRVVADFQQAFEHLVAVGKGDDLLAHICSSSRYWITTIPSWRGYRICKVSTMIPMPLRIAYYGLYVKPKQKSASLLFYDLNLMNSMIKKFSFLLSPKTWFEPIVFPGSLAVLIGAASPRILNFFAGGFSRRNAFGLIQEYCTSKEIASFEGSPRFARRLIRIEFSGQK